MVNSTFSLFNVFVTSPAIFRTTPSDHSSSSVASTTVKETATFLTLKPFTLAQRRLESRGRGNGYAGITRPHQTMAQNNYLVVHLEFKMFFVMSQNDENIWKTINIIKANTKLE